MYRNDSLSILTGKVLEVTGQTIMIAPGTPVELPPDYPGGDIEVGQLVLVRARRVRGHYIAESVLPQTAATTGRCRHCGRRLTQNDLKDACEACRRGASSGGF